MRLSLVALISLLALTACDSTRSLKELRQAQPATDPYRVALAQEYRTYSEEKLKAYDWWASRYFADKGLMAAYDRNVEPEEPANWSLSSPEYTEARGRLLAVIETQQTTQPEQVAVAVVDYDRWLELAHNAWDTPRIEGARDMFYATLEELESPLPAMDEHTAAPRKARAEEKPIPSVAETTSAILYFPFDAEELTSTARAALAEMLKYIKQAGNVIVSINGHADRAGRDDYNMTLSDRRARFVMQTLKEAGVPEEQMEYFAFGETDPKVKTEDGVAEPYNRRVEIFLE